MTAVEVFRAQYDRTYTLDYTGDRAWIQKLDVAKGRHIVQPIEQNIYCRLKVGDERGQGLELCLRWIHTSRRVTGWDGKSRVRRKVGISIESGMLLVLSRVPGLGAAFEGRHIQTLWEGRRVNSWPGGLRMPPIAWKAERSSVSPRRQVPRTPCICDGASMIVPSARADALSVSWSTRPSVATAERTRSG